MKKKLLSVLLALALCLSLLPTAVFAAESVTYRGSSGYEETCTEYTLLDSAYVRAHRDGDGNVTIGEGWYVVSSDVTISGSLILAEGESDAVDIDLILCDGATLTVAGVDSQQSFTENFDKTTNLTVYGQSGGTGKLLSGGYVRQDSTFAFSCGIYVCGTLKVYGGVVEASGRDLKNCTVGAASYGIFANKMRVELGAVTATGGEVSGTGGNASCGVYVEKDNLTVDDGGALIATGGSVSSSANGAESYGIYIYRDDMTARGGGSVTAISGSATATGDGCIAYSCGLYVDEDLYVDENAGVIVTGGNATATGDGGYAYADGLCVDEDELELDDRASLTVTGGNATAQSGTAVTCGVDVYGENNAATVDDGACLSITCGDASSVSGAAEAYGLRVRCNDLDVEDGGVVTVIGGDATTASDSEDAKTSGIYVAVYYHYDDADGSETVSVYDLNVDNGSVITVTGGNAEANGGNAYASGIYVSDDVDINYDDADAASSIVVTGGNATSISGWALSYGVESGYINAAEDSRLDAAGGSAASTSNAAYSYGIYGGYIDVFGGVLNGVGGSTASASDESESCGIAANNLDVYVAYSDAVATGIGGAATGPAGKTYSNGISVWAAADVYDGGTVIATGGTVNGSILADFSADINNWGTFTLYSDGKVRSGRDGGAVRVRGQRVDGDDRPAVLSVQGGSIRLCGDGDYLEKVTVEVEDTTGGAAGVKLADLLATGYAFYVDADATAPIHVSSVETLENVVVKPHTCTLVQGGDGSYACSCGRSYGMEPVPYLDENGGTRYCGSYTVLDSAYAGEEANRDAEGGILLRNGWYVVKSDLTLTDSLSLAEDAKVHLILCDEAELTVGGIEAEYERNALSIYAQSAGDDMGELTVGAGGIKCTCYGGLTVNGGDITVSGVSNDGNSSVYGIQSGADLVVNGGSITVDGISATVSADSIDAYAYGICVYEDLIINGGSVTVRSISASQTANSGAEACGIYSSYNTIVNGGSVTVEGISAGSAVYAYAYGIDACDGMTVNGGSVTVDGSTFTAAGRVENCGIAVDDALTMTGGTLTVNGAAITSTDSDATDCGIYTESFCMTGGTLTVNPGTVAAEDYAATYGIDCEALTLTAGTLSAAAGCITAAENGESYGIYVEYDYDVWMTVTGGSVTGIGGDLSAAVPYAYSCGIYVEGYDDYDGQLTITDGSVKGTGGSVGGVSEETGYSRGIRTDYLTVRSGSVTATGSNESSEIFVYYTFDLSGGTVRSDRDGGAVRVCAEPLIVSGGSLRIFDCYLYGVRALGSVNLADLPADGYAYFAVYVDDEYEKHDIGFVALEGKSSLQDVYVRLCQHSYTGGSCDYCGQSGSSGQTITAHPVTIVANDHGAILSSRKRAQEGVEVTITVSPNAGWVLESLHVVDEDGNAVELERDGDDYIFAMPVGGVTVSAEFAAQSGFVDVTPDKYFYDAVNWAAANGITGGVDATHFAPYASCTRAQIVTFLWRAAGCPEPLKLSGFADVSVNAYYAKAVAWAVEKGITGGTTATTFSPNATCTRAHAAAFLFRYAEAVGRDVSVGEDTNILSYSDALTVPEYAIPAFQWACGADVLAGNNGALQPSNGCTRAQIVTMLYRLLEQ